MNMRHGAHVVGVLDPSGADRPEWGATSLCKLARCSSRGAGSALFRFLGDNRRLLSVLFLLKNNTSRRR